MTMPTATTPRRICSQENAAAAIGSTTRSIRNWLHLGYITGYRVPTARAVRVDLDEILAALATNPKMRGGLRSYGPKAKIVALTGTVIEYVPPALP